MHRVFAACCHVVHMFLVGVLVVGLGSTGIRAQDRPSTHSVQTIPGMPPVVDAPHVRLVGILAGGCTISSVGTRPSAT